MKKNFREKRVFVRFPCNFLVSLQNPQLQKEADVHSKDISAQGIGLVGFEPFQVGEDLELWVHLPGDSSPIHTYGKVMWVKEEGKMWRSGVKFDALHLLPIGVALDKAEVL